MKGKITNNKLLQFSSTGLIWGSILSLIVLFLFVAYNNRLSPGDDMFFFSEVQEKGIIQPLIDFRHNTRFSSFFIFNLFFYFADGLANTPVIIFIYHALFLFTLVVSIFLFFNEIFKRIFYHSPYKTDIIQLPGLFLLIIFFGVPQLIETWFWVIGSTVYGLPIIATLMGCYALLNKSNGIMNRLILIVSLLIVGGALETLAIVNLLFIGLIIACSFKSSYFKPIRAKAIVAGVSVLFLAGINFLSGGNTSRLTYALQNPSVDQTGFKEFILSFVDQNNMIVGICLLLIILTGAQLTSSGFKMRTISGKHIFYIAILLLIVGAITLIPLIFVFEGWGPERAWIPFHFFVYIAAFILFMYFGNQSNRLSVFKLETARFILSGTLFILLMAVCFKQFPQVRRHRIAYDYQIEKIAEGIKDNRVEALELEPAPSSGYVVDFKLSPDTVNWNNLVMRRALKSNFSVYMADSLSDD